jgi:uncharacterized membrane protein YqjE
MDEQEPTPPPGLQISLRRLGATILAIVHNRLELVVVELQEHRIRLIEALWLVVAAIVLAFFTLTLAAAALILLVWKEFGVAGLFILSGLGLLGTLLVGLQLRTRLKSWPLLEGTLAELKKDREWLEKK